MTLEINRTKKHDDGSEELFLPHRYKAGHYKVFKRYHGDDQEKASGAIKVRFDEIPAYLNKGYSLWMSGERKGAMGLITPNSIKVTP